MLQYLNDLRKMSNGQQDINLFFARILDEKNPEYRRSFNQEYMNFVNRALKKIEEKKKGKETTKEMITESEIKEGEN